VGRKFYLALRWFRKGGAIWPCADERRLLSNFAAWIGGGEKGVGKGRLRPLVD